MCRVQSRLARGYPYTTSCRTVQRRHPAISGSELAVAELAVAELAVAHHSSLFRGHLF